MKLPIPHIKSVYQTKPSQIHYNYNVAYEGLVGDIILHELCIPVINDQLNMGFFYAVYNGSVDSASQGRMLIANTAIYMKSPLC